MCWFVTLAVPDAAVAALDRACTAHRELSFWRGLDTPTTRVFPKGTTCVQVTAGGCSCDLYTEPGKDPAAKLDKERARLLGKGWSAAKVQRALDAKADSAARPDHRSTAREGFQALVATLVEDAGLVHVHAHFHGGDQNANDVPPVATATVSLQAFATTGFPPDTLATIRAAT